MGIGQWLQNAAADVSHWINSVGGYTAPASQYRDPNEAVRENAPQQAQSSVDPMLQTALGGMNWLRNNLISQPISTAFLMSGEMSEKPLSQQGNFLFNSSNWDQAWNASKHISPGQALGLNPDQQEYSKAVNSPLTYYKPADALLPQGFNQLPTDQQNSLLEQAGMPAVGNQFIEQKRQDSSFFKYGSGTADFAFSWYVDPTVLADKAVGRVRGTLVTPGEGGLLKGALFPEVTQLTRPVPTFAQRVTGGSLGGTLLSKITPQGSIGGQVAAGWSKVDITNRVNSS